MGNTWLLPFGMFLAGTVWLVVVLAFPWSLSADRPQWHQQTCQLVDKRIARIVQSATCLSNAKYRDSCGGNVAHCIVLLRCSSDDRTALADGDLIAAFSTSAIMKGSIDKLPLCALDSQTNVSVLRNPSVESQNATGAFNLGSVCSYGVDPIECCALCSELDSHDELDSLRREILLDAIAPPLGFMAGGVAIAILFLCITHWPEKSLCKRWRERQEQARVDRVMDMLAAHRYNPPPFVAPPHAPLRSAPLPPVQLQHRDDNVAAPGRRHRRRRRQRRGAASSAGAAAAAGDADPYDTSPSIVKCSTCETMLGDNALGCTRCERVAPERLEQMAFSFRGGEVTCTICIEDIALDELIVALPCVHQYHVECIAEWVRSNNRCPQCSSPVVIANDEC